MKRIWTLWQLRLAEMGWPAMLGLGLLICAAAMALFVLMPALHRMQQLELDVARLQRDMGQHQGQWMDHSPAASLKTFYQFLPAENIAPAQIATMLAAADSNDIVVDKAEYQLVRDQHAKLSRYQVTLPVQGTYPDIRYFVIDLLNNMPALAINELAFRREDAGSDVVEASLRLTIYLGRPS